MIKIIIVGIFITGLVCLFFGIYNIKDFKSIPKDKIWHCSAVTGTKIFYRDYYKENYIINPIAQGLGIIISVILLLISLS